VKEIGIEQNAQKDLVEGKAELYTVISFAAENEEIWEKLRRKEISPYDLSKMKKTELTRN